MTAAPALAQSFDCAKATTAAERLVCADRKLGALDAELGVEAKKTLAADPARSNERLAEARKWHDEGRAARDLRQMTTTPVARRASFGMETSAQLCLIRASISLFALA
ncbi:hypothetical protein [Methylosinus sp. Ce-a6]|uniref:hypothetical protein n=1 Tax=Methylosinus sp. Ce-a6 TaxID=2172005 RepID=UPI001FCE2FDB|nr:hypothetical protein [Methylosinus sp. Ce-a6]